MPDVQLKDFTEIAVYTGFDDDDYVYIHDDNADIEKKGLLSAFKTWIFGNKTIGGTTAGDIADINSAQTFSNKRLTNPKLNEDVALTRTATDLNACGGLTASRALVSNANGRVSVSSITTTILNYLSGLTGNVQNQIDAIQTAVSASLRYGYQSTFSMSGGGGSQIKEYTEAALLTAMGLSTANYVILAPLNVNIFSYASSTYTEHATAAVKITEQTDNGQVHLTKVEFTSLDDGAYGFSINCNIATKATAGA